MAKPLNVIFRATVTLKDGTVIRASNYGKKAFPIRLNGNGKKKRPKTP